MTTPSRVHHIVVTGDPVCDCHYYTGERTTPDSPKPRGFYPAPKNRGGALLLHDLIEEVMSDRAGVKVEFGLDINHTGLPGHYHSYCLWEPRVAHPQEKDEAKRHLIWRAVDPPLGYGQEDPISTAPSSLGTPRSGLPEPDILVIDDAGLEFRRETSRNRWPEFPPSSGASRPRWVVLKLSGALGNSPLWNELTKRFPDNLIVIITAEQVRRSDIRLSKGLSWEATMEDLCAELAGNPELRPLLQARHVIVTFRSDGAFWLDTRPAAETKERKAMLVFDGTRAEGDWTSPLEGTVFGYLSCFTAAIVLELCRWADTSGPSESKDLDFTTALSAGLSATRKLWQLGHGRVYVDTIAAAGTVTQTVNPVRGFPLKEIALRLREAGEGFVSTRVSMDNFHAPRGQWMMLDEWQIRARDEKNTRPYLQAAFAGAILGPEALGRFPAARFGYLLTVDRQEIESLRILRRLISDYENNAPRDSRPLNIGVFGPPGAGKSFGIKEIAKAVLGEKAPFPTFNLSQFNQPGDLIGALHQVRDLVLAGSTPIVFWDEFDSENYKWLQYLLAPMNDGVFVEGPITHPIGKCIFVFAGATSPNFESFGPVNPEDEDDPLHQKLAALPVETLRHAAEQWRDFVLKKGPDFKSRLVSYLNVLGPNPRRRCLEPGKDGQRLWMDDPQDLCWPIRRAFFIRQKFKLKEREQLKIDRGMLQALLEVPRFKSGARSLEFLCNYLRDQARGGFARRSHLPGNHLLDMHVDAKKFWSICERDLEFLPAAAALARGFHEDWRKNPASRGNECNVPWDQLDEATQASNVQQALRMTTNLAIIGFRLEKGPPLSSGEVTVIRAHIDQHLELLAEAEHNGWMVERIIAGWSYANLPEKDPAGKRHPLLLPYAQLPEHEKEKDRRPIKGFVPGASQIERNEEPVDGYVERVQRAGFRIVPVIVPRSE